MKTVKKGFFKFLTVNYNLLDLHTLVQYVRKVFAQNSDYRRCSGFKVMQEWIDVYLMITKCYTFVIFVTVIGISLFPVVYIVLYGETVDVLPLHLPFVDRSTALGNVQLTCFQMLMVAIGACGLIAADLLMGLFFLYISPFCDLFRLRIAEINAEFVKSPSASHSPEFRWYLRNLIETHKDICR